PERPPDRVIRPGPAARKRAPPSTVWRSGRAGGGGWRRGPDGPYRPSWPRKPRPPCRPWDFRLRNDTDPLLDWRRLSHWLGDKARERRMAGTQISGARGGPHVFLARPRIDHADAIVAPHGETGVSAYRRRLRRRDTGPGSRGQRR